MATGTPPYNAEALIPRLDSDGLRRTPSPSPCRKVKPKPSWPRRIQRGFYTLMIGLGLVGGASYLLASWVEDAPRRSCSAGSAVEARQWALRMLADTGTLTAGEWLDLLAWLPDAVRDGLPPTADGTTHRSPPTACPGQLYEHVHHDRRRTFYCACAYSTDNQVNLPVCGLEALVGNSRAERVEAEHVFPASQFGNFRQCWREPAAFAECETSTGNRLSGRDCCQRVDPTFVAAHNDLHNLYPSVGYINGQRLNYNWGMVQGGETYGRCEIVIYSSIQRA